jgi:hypothetical protein
MLAKVSMQVKRDWLCGNVWSCILNPTIPWKMLEN